MTDALRQDGIVAGRLSSEALAENFADAYPPLSPHEALVAADRCYFCHDAPCITACPTAIDIPLFIRQIQTGSTKGCLLYTSPSPRDKRQSRMPSSA